jgi:Zn-dependent M28 family amino/carboxypeptidase
MALPWIVLVLVLLTVGATWMTSPATRSAIRVGTVADPGRLEKDVRELVELDGFRCFERPADLQSAGSWVAGRLAATGLEVEERSYGVGDLSFAYYVAHYGNENAPVLVVGAHYDTCGEQPGADDNASAVAGALEIARLLAAARPVLRHRIELALWPLEEPPNFGTPAMGSAVHAASLAHMGAEVRGMVSLEMLGYFSDDPGSQSFPVPGMGLLYPNRGHFIAVVGNTGSWWLTRRIKRRMAGATELPVRSFNGPAAVPGINASDHLNFWRQGWDAVMITDTAFYRNPHYHQTSDTPDTLDYQRMADVVTGVYAAITTL